MVWRINEVQTDTRKKRLIITSALVLLFALAVSFALNRAMATGGGHGPLTPKKVYQSDFANSMTTWTYHDDTVSPLVAANPNPTPDHEVVPNPTPEPNDKGAVRLVAEPGEKWNLASLQYSGTKLADIKKLGFDVYTDKPGQAYINLDVNFNSWTANQWSVSPLYHGRLVYVPTVAPNTWESEEAVASNGQWSWSRFDENGNKWPDGSTDANRSWSDIVAAFPNAHISHVSFELALKKPFGSLYLRSDGDAGTATTYYDHVYLKTSSPSKKYNFEIKNYKLDTPVHVSPANKVVVQGSDLGDNPPTWEAVEHPYDLPVMYQYRVSDTKERDEDGAVLGGYTFDEGSNTSHPAVGTCNGTWFWQVRAVDSLGVESKWSKPWKAVVENSCES